MKRILQQGTLKQWACMMVVYLIGFTGFVMMACEDNPNNPAPFLKLLAIKVIGLILFIACLGIGKVFDNKGLLPEFKDEDKEDRI